MKIKRRDRRDSSRQIKNLNLSMAEKKDRMNSRMRGLGFLAIGLDSLSQSPQQQQKKHTSR